MGCLIYCYVEYFDADNLACCSVVAGRLLLQPEGQLSTYDRVNMPSTQSRPIHAHAHMQPLAKTKI